MGQAEGVALRSYLIEDDGDALQVHLIESGEQVGGAVIDIGGRHPDEAWADAVAVGQGFARRNAVT